MVSKKFRNNINKPLIISFFFQPVSQQPQCINDMSFFLSENEFSHNDFYDIVRNIGGDFIEQVVQMGASGVKNFRI